MACDSRGRYWKTDMEQSADSFSTTVWPAIAPMMSGGRFVTTEGNMADDLRRSLDMLAGIDGYHVTSDGMRGVSCRVQDATKSWDTFTVRYRRTTGTETEYAKTRRHIDEVEKGWAVSALTIQAYVKSGSLLGAGVVRTRDLYTAVNTWHDGWPLVGGERDLPNRSTARGGPYLEINRYDRNTFIVVPWNWLEQVGVRVARWSKP